MGQEKTEVIFSLIARMTDEDQPESGADLRESYNQLQTLADQDLEALIEQIPYPRKYAVQARIKEELQSVKLLITVPDLIEKHVIGFFHPTNKLADALQQRYLDNRVRLSGSIPVLITHGSETSAEAKALSAGEKNVTLSLSEYHDLIGYAEETNLDLSAIVSLFQILSPAVPPTQAILIIPAEANPFSKYYETLFRTVDTLVLTQRKKIHRQTVQLIGCSNVKYIQMATDKLPENYHQVCAGEFKTCFYRSNSLSDLFEQLDQKCTGPIHNFYNRIIFSDILSEILWHLAVRKQAYTDRLERINSDLLGEDPNTRPLLKTCQQSIVSEQEELDRLSRAYLALWDEILQRLDMIQNTFQLTERGEAINNHAMPPDRLLGYLYKMSISCAAFPVHDGIQTIRSLEHLAEQYASPALARVTVSAYFHQKPDVADLNILTSYVSRNPFVSKLRIQYAATLGGILEQDLCAISASVRDVPLSPYEHRLLGIHYHISGEIQSALEEFHMALGEGDPEAGEQILRRYDVSEQNRLELANYGVKRIAMQVGKDALERYQQSPDTNQFQQAAKYLNIAAAMGETAAYRLLGDLWFRSAANGDPESKKSLEIALRHYQEGEKDSHVYEKMGTIAFRVKDYRAAREYLSKSNTAEAYFLLGQLYENGLGVAKNRKTALSRYQSAWNMGHAQATARASALMRELEEERRRETVKANQNYRPSYTSSYSSSNSSSSSSGGGFWD